MMIKIILYWVLLLKSLEALHVSHRDDATSPVDSDLYHAIQNCVRMSNESFQNAEKVNKIQINGVSLNLDGFKSFQPADYVSLNISFTDQRLPFKDTEFKNLLVYHAAGCGINKIDEIGTESFPSLKTLNLSNNYITTMKSEVFDHLKDLEALDLNYNCLSIFPFERELLFHVNFKELHLRGNMFIHFRFPLMIFLTANHIAMDFLDLSYNNLTRFENHGLPVKKVVVTNNQLRNLEYIQFGTTLVTIEAQFNQIIKVASNANFENFNLSHNSLRQLSDLSITNAPVSGILDLSYNNITLGKSLVLNEYNDDEDDYEADYIDSAFRPIFRQQHAVNFLNLSYNQIDAFSNLKSMERYKHTKKIDLRGNKIKTLNLPLVKNAFWRLDYLNVQENPMTKNNVEGNQGSLILEVDESPVNVTTVVPETTQTLAPTTPEPQIEQQVTQQTDNSPPPSNTNTSDDENIMTEKPETYQSTQDPFISKNSEETKKRHPTALWVSIFLALLVIPAVLYLAYFRAKWANIRYTRSTFNEAENML